MEYLTPLLERLHLRHPESKNTRRPPVKYFVLAFAIFTSLTATAAPEATFFRVFQGFRKADVGADVFMMTLPKFMNSTLEHYQHRMNNYLVAVTPAQKPAFVPDEFALVAVESKASYDELRATPEGAKYSDSHWTLFDRALSRSVPYTVGVPKVVDLDKSYVVLGDTLDWRAGHTSFFLGLRNERKSTPEYRAFLLKHAQDVVREFAPLGLKGYVFIAQEGYEAAFLNWESAEKMEKALNSPAGQKIQAEAQANLVPLMWSRMEEFNGSYVKYGGFYTTIPR